MRYLTTLSILFLFLSSCKTKEPTYGDILAKSFDQKIYKDFDSIAYFEVVQKELKNDRLFNPKWMKEKVDSTKGFTWIDGQLLNGGTDTLITYLTQLEAHGLKPSKFHVEELEQALDKIKSKKVNDINEAYQLLAKIEILSCDAMVAYANALQNGATNPKKLYGRYFVANDRYTLKKVNKLLDTTLNVSEALKSVQPKNRFYKKFQQILANNNLNKSERMSVLASMERLRWMKDDFSDKYVFVNIPEMVLHMISDHAIEGSMNVCVGETENKPFSNSGQNHETPMMKGVLDRMQVNPVWNIPQSIVKKELLSSVRANPGYLESRNMVVYNTKGQLVDPYSINWQADSVENFRFKQNPGYDNSLGNIKFIFANPYSIYLHDTPAKGKFQSRNRAVSHGCVRVEDPKRLAAFLVNNEKEATKIAEEIDDSKHNSRWVSMKKGIPVHLSYYTTWLDENDKIVHYDDIYGYDARLHAALKNFIN